jgi:TolA-binding protein
MAGFEIERFEWTAPDRLEVVGRWHGVRGRRFLRPTLDVEVDGERRRMLALLEHKPWAPAEGEDWVAAFSWRGDQAQFDDAELTVSPDLAVQLPTPNGGLAKSKQTKATAALDLREARPPRATLLRGELATAVAEVQRLTEELERVRKAHSVAVEELHARLGAEQAKVGRLEGELKDAAERVAEAAREVDELREERDVAAAASEAASAEAERARRERDAALQRHAAGNREREALREARDSAREERNAWMSRARAAAVRPVAEPAAEADAGPAPDPAPASGAAPAPDAVPEPDPSPPREPAAPPEPAPEAPPAQLPPSERRTIQIGARPGPVQPRTVPPPQYRGARPFLEAWGPRLVVIATLLVLVAAIVLLLGGAL